MWVSFFLTGGVIFFCKTNMYSLYIHILFFSTIMVGVGILKKYFKDVSREFDEFRVKTHLCKLCCWYLTCNIPCG